MVATAGTEVTAAAPKPVLGLLASAGSGVLYSITALVSRHVAQRIPALMLTTMTTTIGALTLLPIAVVTGIGFSPNLRTISGLIFLGVMTTAVAYGLYYAGLKTVAGSTAAVLTLLEPVTAAVLAVILLTEPMSMWTVFGSVLLLSSIAALYLSPMPRQGEPLLAGGPLEIGYVLVDHFPDSTRGVDVIARQPSGADSLSGLVMNDDLQTRG
nr:DMT family transporter [Nakamurella antarctica]